MAVSNTDYFAPLTTKGVVDKIHFSSSMLTEDKTRNSVSRIKTRLQDQIKEIKDTEDKLFTALGLTGTTAEEKIQDLRNRIKQCYNLESDLMSKVTGPGVKDFVDQVKKIRELDSSENQEFQKKIEQLFYDVCDDATKKIILQDKPFEEATAAEVLQVIFENMDLEGYAGQKQKAFGKGNAGAGVGKLKKLYQGAFNKRMGDLAKSELTDEMLRRFASMQNNAVTKKVSHTKSSSITIGTSTRGDSLVLYMNYNEGDFSADANMRAIQEFTLQNNLYLFFKKYFNTTDQIFLGCCRDIIFNNPIKDFFYGGNYSKDIVGLLGEIMGLYYTRVILNDTKTNNTVNWQGGNIVGSKKPHEDLIFTDSVFQTYGIQIKNTTFSDILSSHRGHREDGYTDFVNRDFLNFMKNSINTSIDAPYIPPISTFQAIYTMEAFNVSYDPAFDSLRSGIETLAARADAVISLYATSLLYMQTEAMSHVTNPGNTVYFIGGSGVVVASEMLSKIYDELDDIEKRNRAFKVVPTFTANIDKNVHTYKDYRDLGYPIEGKAGVRGKLKLTSAFNFSSLGKELLML